MKNSESGEQATKFNVFCSNGKGTWLVLFLVTNTGWLQMLALGKKFMNFKMCLTNGWTVI